MKVIDNFLEDNIFKDIQTKLNGNPRKGKGNPDRIQRIQENIRTLYGNPEKSQRIKDKTYLGQTRMINLTAKNNNSDKQINGEGSRPNPQNWQQGSEIP